MKEKFRLYIPTGTLFAVDPAYISGKENKEAIHEKTEGLSNEELLDYLKSTGFVGIYEWGLEPGVYNYPLNAVLTIKRHKSKVETDDWRVKSETGALLFADMKYFKELIEHYELEEGLTKSYNPSAAYEKKLSALMGSDDELTFNQIISTTYEYYEFNGPGEYWIRNYTFSKARRRNRK